MQDMHGDQTPVETGELLYAELKGHAFYRFQPAGSKTARIQNWKLGRI